MPNYAPRVSMSFMDLSGIIEIWSQSCEKLIAYEHEADEEVAKTHVHFLMINSTYATAEQYKRQFYDIVHTHEFGEERPKGNDLWAWKHKDYPNPDVTYITYMGKGSLLPKFNKGFDLEIVQRYVNMWEDRDYVAEKPTKQLSEFDQLLFSARNAYKAKTLKINMTDIKNHIKSHYLRRERPVPRSSDTNRYAYSIYAIISNKTKEADLPQLDFDLGLTNSFEF